MNDEQILAALMALPAADMITATTIDAPIGAGSYYRADTVVRLLHGQWKPIETAPRDGTDVLIFGENTFAVAAWNGTEWRDMGDIGWGGMQDASPTHWRPLLAPDLSPNASGKLPQPEATTKNNDRNLRSA